MNNYSTILARAEVGCNRRYGRLDAQMKTRLAAEIEMLRAKGGACTLLMAADVADFAREHAVEMESGVGYCHSLLCYALGIAHIDPIRWGLYAERLLLEPKRFRIEILLDARWVDSINAHFGLPPNHSVRVMGWHHSTEFAQCQERIGNRIEIPEADAAALAQFQAPSFEGLYQCGRLVPYPRPILDLDDLVAVWHKVHNGGAAFQESIVATAIRSGYAVSDALRMINRLYEGDPNLVAAERARFTQAAQAHGASASEANVQFDGFLRGGVSLAATVHQASLVYRSAFLKAHYPKAWLETTLSWRDGVTAGHPLQVEFARLGVCTREVNGRLVVEQRSEGMSDDTHILMTRTAILLEQQERELATSGRGFNLVQVLGCSAKELSHSAFIAELLSEDGSHRQGRLFLDAFFAVLADQDVMDTSGFVKLKWSVKVEMATPKDKGKAGRIDIALLDEDGKHAILIENKIYAGDQDRQLRRYVDAAKGRGYASPHCLYLTLHGTKPKPYSLDGLEVGSDVRCVSYEKHIGTWLSRCRESLSEGNHLAYVIEQYQDNIPLITKGVSPMDDALTTLIESTPGHLEAAYKISDMLSHIQANLHLRFWKELIAALEDPEKGLTVKKKHKDTTIRDYHNRSKRSLADIGIEVSRGKGAPKLKVQVHDNLWYGWEEDVSTITPYDILDGMPWKYPRGKLNFWEFDKDTRQRLNEMGNTVDGLVEEIQDLLKKLEGDEG